ncbi:MAG: ABC transporter permease [Gammaproteobacteria bacterium]|nr:ABC transporter permease [Gammaproteobacteria bacterium]
MIQLPSFKRMLAVMSKEFMQMRRDRTTFAMMIAIPLMQLILFGFAIDLNPKHLPAVVVMQDPNPITQDVLVRLEQSQYFKFIAHVHRLKEAKLMMARNQVKMIVYFPAGFYRKVLKGQQPAVLLLVDGSDPIIASRSVAVFNEMPNLVGQNRLPSVTNSDNRLFKTVSLSAFNPEIKTAFHIVPGLLGVVLTMTMVVITSIAITREFERGTMEMLLATPIKPIEVIIGKILPYVGVGYIQVFLILSMAKLLFGLPIQGSILLLILMCLPFIIANLAVGLSFSTLASNQLQAMQSAMFFFLPSILLSGFMFPIDGMPTWAQWIGKILPLTHFLVIVRGIILKGDGFWDIYPALLKIIFFTALIMLISFRRYRKTLD